MTNLASIEKKSIEELKENITLIEQGLPEIYKSMEKLGDLLDDYSKERVKRIEEYLELLKKRLNTLLNNKQFTLMRQGTAINELAKVTTSKNEEVNMITGAVNIKKSDFLVTIENISALAGLRTSTHKLLDELMMKFTEGNGESLIVNMPLSEHMRQRGLKDEKEARRQVKEDLETLSKITLSFNEKIEGKPKDFFNLKIIGSHGIKNGVITASFDAVFHELILKYYIMPMPRAFLAFSDKYNPNSYHLGRRIALHKRMNYGKPNQDLISVLTLLDACPNLAKYEEIYKQGKSNFTQRIIEPFERDMNALEATEIFTWEYCHSNGLPLSDDDLEKLYGKQGGNQSSYDFFKTLLIKISWKDYPEWEVKKGSKKEIKHRQKRANQ